MTNEPLGIVEEGQRRYTYYADYMRRRVLATGPQTRGAPYAEPVNPFGSRQTIRLRNNRKPFHLLTGSAAMRRRAIWPEAHYGLNISQVAQAVALEAGIGLGELLSSNRERRLAWPRHVAMYLIDRYCPDYSLPDVAFVFHRDHTSVMYGIEATLVRLEKGEPGTKELVAKVHARLRAIAQAQQ
jgi:hypothetical protein